MTFLEWAFGPRSKSTWKSWWTMTATLPLVILLTLCISAARREVAIAKRQQTAVGRVTAWDPSNHNQCRYNFAVSGKEFSGTNSCPTNTAIIGQQVEVYFDPRNPTTNALEDFSATSSGNWGMALDITIGIAILAVVIGFSKLRHV